MPFHFNDLEIALDVLEDSSDRELRVWALSMLDVVDRGPLSTWSSPLSRGDELLRSRSMAGKRPYAESNSRGGKNTTYSRSWSSCGYWEYR